MPMHFGMCVPRASQCSTVRRTRSSLEKQLGAAGPNGWRDYGLDLRVTVQEHHLRGVYLIPYGRAKS
jgi:hypothetical protein